MKRFPNASAGVSFTNAGRRGWSLALAIAFSAALAPNAQAIEKATQASLVTIASADGSVAADEAAAAAAKSLQDLPGEQVIEVLQGLGSATPRGRNWLRSLAADVCDNGDFPQGQLTSFFQDRANDSDARYVAFQLLTQRDPAQKKALLAEAETDPSLPVRFLKIEWLIKQASEQQKDGPDQAIKILRGVIANGRSPKQLESASKLLKGLGVENDLATELGMMATWWVIGPFDNTDSENFSTSYRPENQYVESGSPVALDSSGDPKPEMGKGKKEISWQRITSDDSLGMVDLNEPLANEKDAVAYVFTRFNTGEAPFDPAAQIRIGCVTANKVWVNGKLVSSNEVYHSGTRIDQYVDDCELVEGENTVLVKVLQNAQTQPWAQDWQFQFRLTRPDGSAIKTTILP